MYMNLMVWHDENCYSHCERYLYKYDVDSERYLLVGIKIIGNLTCMYLLVS